jgi:sulfur carrier protein
MKIKIQVNGKAHELDNDAIPDLDALVKSMVTNDKGMIVELNQKIINRNHWQEYKVNNGDKIELINLVGGG